VSRKAFTLIEMMIVLMISLVMMTIILPVFQVTSRTVQVVERKLAVYESARNVLDQIAFEFRTAVQNEQGDGFGIKHRYVMEDNPFTPINTDDPGTPYPTDTTKRFKGSRREADAICFGMTQPGGYRNNSSALFPGSMSFPLAHPEGDQYYPEGWQAMIWHTWSNPYLSAGDRDPADWDGGTGVEKIEAANSYDAVSNKMAINEVTGSSPKYNTVQPGHTERFNDWQPGGERIKYDPYLGTSIGYKKWRQTSGIRVMDIEFAHWNDVTRAFIRYSNYYSIYFAPAPKAVLVTITACDINKRAFVTLSRVVRIPIGTGDGTVFNSVSSDSYWVIEPATGLNKGFNRNKNLGALQPW
jgi:prepilin-type N-terminal cleavage/methylation domain-containing protein